MLIFEFIVFNFVCIRDDDDVIMMSWIMLNIPCVLRKVGMGSICMEWFPGQDTLQLVKVCVLSNSWFACSSTLRAVTIIIAHEIQFG